jgi:diguanylate cyclase (GGDEF)-like protein/PAS domain S-box-containing protein
MTDESRAERLIGLAPMIVMIVDDQGEITWLGGALERLTGYQPEDLVGTNILDHIDVAWNPPALESVGFAMTQQGLQRPMLFRIRRRDGSTFVCEATANAQMHDPEVGGLVAYLRQWDERHLLDVVIEHLAGGATLDETLQLLVEVMGAETLEADGAILVEPFAGRFFRVVGSARLPSGLRADAGQAGTPWHQASLVGEPRAVPVDQLTEPVRSWADEAGYRWCWAFPVMGSGGPDGCLVLWRRADEEPDYTCRVLLDNLVRVTGLVLARERDAAALRHAASHDALTGLANRSRFFEHLERSLGDASTGPLVGVLYIDLDEFKPVNDRLGHGAGDRVLVEVARRLRDVTREGDLVARLGGDEFAVLCSGLPDLAVVRAVAERLSDAMREPITVGAESVRVGASVGIAVAPPGTCSIDELVDAADGALYAAKRDARGTVKVAGS